MDGVEVPELWPNLQKIKPDTIINGTRLSYKKEILYCCRMLDTKKNTCA